MISSRMLSRKERIRYREDRFSSPQARIWPISIWNMPLEEVIKLSSLNAAEYYGFGGTTGSIRIGKDADFVVISDDYKAMATYVQGRKVFDRAVETPVFNPDAYR